MPKAWPEALKPSSPQALRPGPSQAKPDVGLEGAQGLGFRFLKPEPGQAKPASPGLYSSAITDGTKTLKM
jgi:hypothetical protein